MRSSYLHLYNHYVWSTYKRNELIDEELEPILRKLVEDKIIENKSRMLAFCCSPDQIHLLVNIHPSVSVSMLAKEIKGYSSYPIANQIRPGSFFRWQGGYGARTVSKSNLQALSKYIKYQKEHHGNSGLDELKDPGN